MLNTNSTGSGGVGAGSANAGQPRQQQPQYIRATHSAPSTPAKLTGLTAVIRAQQPGIPANVNPAATTIASTAAVARTPPAVIQQQQPKVHIQAGQQQQSIGKRIF